MRSQSRWWIFLVTKQMVAVFVPRIRREIVEVIQLVLVERIKGRVADQMDIPVHPVITWQSCRRW